MGLFHQAFLWRNVLLKLTYEVFKKIYIHQYKFSKGTIRIIKKKKKKRLEDIGKWESHVQH